MAQPRTVDRLTGLPWSLIFGLGGLGLVHPLVSIIQEQMGTPARPATSIIITGLVTMIWVALVAVGGVAQPVLTLCFAGLTYAVLSIGLSGIVSPMLTGDLDGPLTMPWAIFPILLVNAAWGLAAGSLALLLQRLLRLHVPSWQRPPHQKPPGQSLPGNAPSDSPGLTYR